MIAKSTMFKRHTKNSMFVVVVVVVELSPGGQSYLPARSRDRNERGETALHVAAIKGDHEGVKKLLDQGISPNVADFAGKLVCYDRKRAKNKMCPKHSPCHCIFYCKLLKKKLKTFR